MIATLEGPGISKSECPVCHKPCWKNDLSTSYTVNNALVHAAGLTAEVQRGREAERRLRQRRAAGEPPAAMEALGAARPGSAGALAAAPARLPSRSEAGGSAGKRRRRGRSVPEDGGVASAEEAEEEHRQLAAQQPPAIQQQQGQEGWRERQPQSLWGTKRAAPKAQPAPAAAAPAAVQQPVAAVAAGPDPAPTAAAEGAAALAAGVADEREGPEEEVSESPVPVLYDSDWEERVCAALALAVGAGIAFDCPCGG